MVVKRQRGVNSKTGAGDGIRSRNLSACEHGAVENQLVCPAKSRGGSGNWPGSLWRAEPACGVSGCRRLCPGDRCRTLWLWNCACVTFIKVEVKEKPSSLRDAGFRITASFLGYLRMPPHRKITLQVALHIIATKWKRTDLINHKFLHRKLEQFLSRHLSRSLLTLSGLRSCFETYPEIEHSPLL